MVPPEHTVSGRSSRQGSDTETQARINAIIADLVSRLTPAPRRIRRLLSREPTDLVVQSLAAAAQAETRWNRYVRIANMLGYLDNGPAQEVLKAQAARKDRLAVHAVRALGRMSGAGVEDALWTLVGARRMAVRRAAAVALARRRTGRIVAPLCRYARRTRSGIPDRALVDALKSMGRVRDLLAYLLTDDTIKALERVQAIEDLEAMRREFGRINAERILARDAEDPRCAWRRQARETLDLYRAKRTLLRPADRLDSDTLLRPAHGPDQTPSEMLLRPSETAETPDTPPPEEGVIQGVLHRLRDLLDGF